MPTPITDLSKLAIHTITTKPWDLETCVTKFAAAGVQGLTVWRQWLDGRDPAKAGELIRGAGLEIVSLCRGGFFPGLTANERQAAIDQNKACIAEAHALGAKLIVLVCGAVPGQSLEESRRQITEGIAACLPEAAAAGVTLAIEPLHPMYAADRSAVNTLGQANDICDALASPYVGVAADVFHLWWDPALQAEIARCGRSGYLRAFHICDWKSPMEDMLNDRGLMGEGCINIPQIRGWVEEAGFTGFNEVEIFSNKRWAGDQDQFLSEIIEAYRSHS